MAQRGTKRRSGSCWQYSLDDGMYRHMRFRKWLEGTACRTLPSARLLTPQATPALPFCPLHPTRHCTPASAFASRPSKGLCSHRRLVPTFRGWLGRRWGLRHGTHVYREHGIPTDARRCFHMAVARMALRWSSKRPTKRASLCDGSAWPVVPLGSGETAAHRLCGAAIPTQRWAIYVTRRVKWAVALDLDS